MPRSAQSASTASKRCLNLRLARSRAGPGCTPAFRARLVEAGVLDEGAAAVIAAEEAARVAASVERAEADPLPDVSAAWTDITA